MMWIGGAIGACGAVGAVVAPIVAIVVATKKIGDIRESSPADLGSPGLLMLKWAVAGVLVAAFGAAIFLCALVKLRRMGAARPYETDKHWS
jgi:nitrate/nitrite transporter NarK